MTQLTLFDAPHLHRPTDPAPSHEAASHIAPKLAGLRAEFVSRLSRLGTATANEVAAGNESIRKRAKELERLGIIRVVGSRPCRVTNMTASVYGVAK